MQLRFVGESGYEHPSADASDAMETGAHQSGSSASDLDPVGRTDQHPNPAPVANNRPTAPLPIHPALTRVRPVVAHPRADAAVLQPSVPSDADRRRFSLWDGLAAPMELSAQKISGVSEDEAAALGRRDYESHILGQRDAGANPSELHASGAGAAGSLDSRPSLSNASGSAPAVAGPELFVTLSLDLKNHPDATLKDAVADLGRVAGFRQDPRFAPSPVGAGTDQVALWGWISPSRVGAAMKVPTVARLEVDPAARRDVAETATEMLLGVRVPPGRSLAEAVALLEADPAAPGLRVRRTIGTQSAPGTAETVLVVEASVPISILPKLMALHDVVKMVPAPPAPAPQRPQRRIAEELHGFLNFAVGQSPMLLVLTLLMLLPWVGSGVAKAVRVFVPYR